MFPLHLCSSPTGTVLEYKYVVREGDGGVVQWKPGENFTLRVPLGEGDSPLGLHHPSCFVFYSTSRRLQNHLPHWNPKDT